MLLPTSAQANPFLKLVESLTGKDPTAPAAAAQAAPLNISGPKANQDARQPRHIGGLGNIRFNGGSQDDKKKFIDGLVASEFSQPVQHWGQAIARPLLGLIKRNADQKAADFDLAQKQQKANALMTGIQSVRSGMSETGDVDLASALAGVTDPALIEQIVSYADKTGDRRYSRFADERRFNTGREDEMWNRDFRQQQFDQGVTQADRAYNANREDAQRRQEEFDRRFYSDYKPVEDNEGNQVYIRPAETPGGYEKVDGIRPPKAGLETNRKLTPAELATNREIEQSRRDIIDYLQKNGPEKLQDALSSIAGNDMLKKAAETAAKSMNGEDPGFAAFREAIAGRQAPPALPPLSVPTSRGMIPAKPAPQKSSDRLIPNGPNTLMAPGELVRPVPDQAPASAQPGGQSAVPEAKSQARQVFEQQQRMLQQAGAINPYKFVPSKNGKIDFASMKPGQFYYHKANNGRTQVITKLPDGNIEVVSE